MGQISQPEDEDDEEDRADASSAPVFLSVATAVSIALNCCCSSARWLVSSTSASEICDARPLYWAFSCVIENANVPLIGSANCSDRPSIWAATPGLYPNVPSDTGLPKMPAAVICRDRPPKLVFVVGTESVCPEPV